MLRSGVGLAKVKRFEVTLSTCRDLRYSFHDGQIASRLAVSIGVLDSVFDVLVERVLVLAV